MLSHLSHVQLFETLWTTAHEAPLSMEFSRREYWSGLPFPSPGDLPDPEIEPRSPALQADFLPSEPPRKVKVKVKSLSHVQLFSIPWAVVYQAPLSTGKNTGAGSFSLLQGIFLTQGSDPGIKPMSPTFQADALTSEPLGKPSKSQNPLQKSQNPLAN